MVINIIYWVFFLALDGFCPHTGKILISVGSGWFVCFLCFFCLSFVLHCVCCAVVSPALKRKAVPLRARGEKEAKTPKPEEGVKESPSKVTKSLSFTAQTGFQNERWSFSAEHWRSENVVMHTYTGILEYTLLFWVLLPDAHSPVHYNTRFT